MHVVRTLRREIFDDFDVHTQQPCEPHPHSWYEYPHLCRLEIFDDFEVSTLGGRASRILILGMNISTLLHEILNDGKTSVMSDSERTLLSFA